MNNTENEKTRPVRYYNFFHALSNLPLNGDNGSTSKFFTEALVKILYLPNWENAEWLEGEIEMALEEKDEAKQIYKLAESLRIEYTEDTISDISTLGKLTDGIPDKERKYSADLLIDFLMGTIYSIDLFDVAKELIRRYKLKSEDKTNVLNLKEA